jgi:hypothetical protein
LLHQQVGIVLELMSYELATSCTVVAAKPKGVCKWQLVQLTVAHLFGIWIIIVRSHGSAEEMIDDECMNQ